MKTIITHFYNEEYLLPWWLEHHKKYFDFGLLIDYASTDNSVEIIRRICPHWQIVSSANAYFDARGCDHEVMFYERQIPGWRIALTITEFLHGNLDYLMNSDSKRQQYFVPGIRFCSWDLDTPFNKEKPLWEQVTTGIPYFKDQFAHQCRSLHNFNDIEYTVGRHYLEPSTDQACIFHYAHCIQGPKMLERRLQIQKKISLNDKLNGLGNHHYYSNSGGDMDVNSLWEMYSQWLSIGVEDCSNLIKKFAIT